MTLGSVVVYVPHDNLITYGFKTYICFTISGTLSSLKLDQVNLSNYL
jgi:hypothetical protein